MVPVAETEGGRRPGLDLPPEGIVEALPLLLRYVEGLRRGKEIRSVSTSGSFGSVQRGNPVHS